MTRAASTTEAIVASATVRQTWLVLYRDPLDGLVEVEIECARSDLIPSFRKYLASMGLSSHEFNLDRDLWFAELVEEWGQLTLPL